MDVALCHRLSAAFYAKVDRDPVLRPFFPGKTLRCAIEAFAAFLVQFFDGPAEDSQFRFHLSLQESHLRFAIGAAHRDAWMENMEAALEEVQIEASARRELRALFEHASAYIVNAAPTPSVRRRMGPEMSRRWKRQLALDQAVAAVHSGNAERAIELAGTLTGNRSVFAGLLALMMASGDAALLTYVREQVMASPDLIHVRYYGRTLLHRAAACANLEMVRLLLELGTAPTVTDGGGHTPLYSAANECQVSGGGDIVRELHRAGADIDACGNVKRCTPLHMAARRGNVEIAEALLGCGANRDARDSQGVTPLQRAINCRKAAVAALLRSRGAR